MVKLFFRCNQCQVWVLFLFLILLDNFYLSDFSYRPWYLLTGIFRNFNTDLVQYFLETICIVFMFFCFVINICFFVSFVLFDHHISLNLYSFMLLLIINTLEGIIFYLLSYFIIQDRFYVSVLIYILHFYIQNDYMFILSTYISINFSFSLCIDFSPISLTFIFHLTNISFVSISKECFINFQFVPTTVLCFFVPRKQEMTIFDNGDDSR